MTPSKKTSPIDLRLASIQRLVFAWPTTQTLLLLVCAASLIFVTDYYLSAAEPRRIEFNRDIRPILSNKCFRCHGPDSAKREANLRFDREESAKAAHDGIAAIVAGNIDNSELVRRITSDAESERMPPSDSGKQLTAKEIDVLKQWISEGAKWELAWAYLPPARQPIPTVRDSSWPLNWIDKFILARLESEGVKPSSEADRTTLVRRLFIDLTGLPPTPSAVDRFVSDQDPKAYEHQVDALLASPRFGERLAMYWLDLVRFADTVGYEGDQVHHISPYRDYVISAFNRNEPFDDFTREQLAGDLLPSPTLDQTIATGYNRLLRTSTEGGVQPKQYLAMYGADRVRNVSAVWMASTMGCAQCHDHKYDPFTARDFYSLQAFFADIDEADHLYHSQDVTPTTRAPELVVHSPEQAAELLALQSRLADLKARLPALRVANKQVAASGGKIDDNAVDDGKLLATEAKKQHDAIQSCIDKLQANGRKTMITVAIQPRTIRVLPRGDWMNDSGPIVEPAVPKFMGSIDTPGRRPNRLDLANWLTDAEHGVGGLTARVMANRFWYLLFGRGLSAVLDDFGAQGELPDNPQLLDALTLEFIASKWDIKHILKLIVMSRTYRQSSLESESMRQHDPLNRLVARQASNRFQAETIRDSVLSISGLLVDRIGGASIHPYQPAGYYRHLNFPKREYQPDTDSAQWRRGVYVHWQRQFLHPTLKAFDAPSREECTAQRPRSNTPLASLVLLNDPSFVEAARAFAQRILNEGGSTDEDRQAFAFRQAVSHAPDNCERRTLAALLNASRAEYAKDVKAVDELLSVGLAPRPKGLDRTELAAWTIVARAILSMNETLSRN